VALVLLALSLAPTGVLAGPHRARVSKDLADHLKAATGAPVDVIVDGTPEDIRRLAARHGARVKKALARGAVLEITGGQLDAITRDPGVRHVSGDVKVHGTMAVTTQSTGADQVWAGWNGIPGFTGKGVGVAVVDSGVAPHQAL
jgi:subtilisin family serine protease